MSVLLREPHGFEGLGASRVVAHLDCFPVTKRHAWKMSPRVNPSELAHPSGRSAGK